MSKSKRLVFFGNEKLATGITSDKLVSRSLEEQGYEVVSKVAGEIPDDLAALKADAAVLVAYGRIIPQAVTDIFPKGIINIHPSLLPKYRGPSPVEAAILSGDNETGVSLMRLSSKMDAGPVFTQVRLALNGTESKQGLADDLLAGGQKLLLDELPAILEGWQTPKPQMDSGVSYTKLIKKQDGVMDFSKAAAQLEREVRAYSGWPSSHAEIFGKEVVVTDSRVAKDESDGELVMKCRPGYLEVLQLKAPSGRTMSGAEFIRGYKKT